jgi:hypothetical protein
MIEMSEDAEAKRGPGAPVGNLNAQKRLGIDLSQYNLWDVQDVFKLLQVIASATLNGQISPRAAGAVNNSLRIILTYHADVQRAAENKTAIEQLKVKVKELQEKLAKTSVESEEQP